MTAPNTLSTNCFTTTTLERTQSKNMRYKCLVFDHDDTTVNSTRHIHYPCFVEYMERYKPHISYTIDEFISYNFHPGVVEFFTDICGLNKEELEHEEAFWGEYAKTHTADAFPGIRSIMQRHKENGGIIAVVSHSLTENILKDYRHNDLPLPDVIYGWDEPPHERKPSPVPLRKIMDAYQLQPDELLVIDDLKPGLDMARAAQVDFAAACWCFDIPENEEYMRKHANYFCKTVDDLRDVLF